MTPSERQLLNEEGWSVEEVGRLWPRILEQYSGFEQYRRMTNREIPVVILERKGAPTPGT